ncbi:Trm112 family protein [Georgenia sp. Z1491]|uniref:Trm112 family protein n=1 Tax=Georgenia sp. Z1491 TaxID=3416707 RepID=UPI003CEAB0BD
MSEDQGPRHARADAPVVQDEHAGPEEPVRAVRADGASVGRGGLEPWVRALLRCPVSGGELTDDVAPDGTPELRSADSGLAYPVRDGVPVLLEGEARALRP